MENLNIGITVMIIGMSAVFVFLVIMIGAMHLTTKILDIVNKYYPEPTPEKKDVSKKSNSDNDAEIAVAIAAAIREGAGAQ